MATSLLCPNCGYDLRGQELPRCPECFATYDVASLLRLRGRTLPRLAPWSVVLIAHACTLLIFLLPAAWLGSALEQATQRWWRPLPAPGNVCVAMVWSIALAIASLLATVVVARYRVRGHYVLPIVWGLFFLGGACVELRPALGLAGYYSLASYLAYVPCWLCSPPVWFLAVPALVCYEVPGKPGGRTEAHWAFICRHRYTVCIGVLGIVFGSCMFWCAGSPFGRTMQSVFLTALKILATLGVVLATVRLRECGELSRNISVGER